MLYVRYYRYSANVQNTAVHVFTVCICLGARMLYDHIWQVSKLFSYWRYLLVFAEKQNPEKQSSFKILLL